MTKGKFEHPRSKVRARVDHPTRLVTAVPEKIVHAMRLQAGDSIEWIWITEGMPAWCKVAKVQT